jgi:hypothetical protein
MIGPCPVLVFSHLDGPCNKQMDWEADWLQKHRRGPESGRKSREIQARPPKGDFLAPAKASGTPALRNLPPSHVHAVGRSPRGSVYASDSQKK